MFKFDGKVVVDVAELAHRTATHAGALNGVRPNRPVEHVEVVHVLLDDVIAAGPGEPGPTAALPLHVRASLFLVPLPVAEHVAAIPVTLARDDVTDLAIVDAPDDLLIFLA